MTRFALWAVLAAPAFVMALAAPAVADRPHDGLFHAAPGFGYAWDSATGCTLQGRQFIGGFAFEYETRDRLFTGAATTILFNSLLPDAPCGIGADEGIRLAFAFVIGPVVEWYPYEEHGLSLFALAGYANIDHDQDSMYGVGHGVGTTVGIGWEWLDTDDKDHDLLFGLRLQLTAARTWTSAFPHAILAPSLVFTVGAD